MEDILKLKYLLKNPKTLKYTHKWLYSFLDRYIFKQYKTPWLVYDSIEFLDKYCKREHNVFEWGSGGSTLYFNERCNRIVSIEYDKEWHNIIKKILPFNSQIKLIMSQNKGVFVSNHKDHLGKYFDNYVLSIQDYPDEYFDIIVIDGRCRNACLVQSNKKLKKNGIIVLDNSDRKRYKMYEKFFPVSNYKKIDFYGLVPFSFRLSKTTIFIKDGSL